MKLQVHVEFDPADPEEVARVQAMLRTIIASDAAKLRDTREALDAIEQPALDLKITEPAATSAATATPRRRGRQRAASAANGAASSEPAEAAVVTDENVVVAASPEPEPSTPTEDAIAALREQLAFEGRRVATGYGVIRARDLATSIVNSGRIVPNAEAVPDVVLDQTLAAFQAVI